MNDGCMFRVWAPNASRVTLQISNAQGIRAHDMKRRDGDQFVLHTSGRAGDRYFYIVDGHKPVPDPVSRLLPEGVHGPAEIVDSRSFAWHDAGWRGLRLKD